MISATTSCSIFIASSTTSAVPRARLVGPAAIAITVPENGAINSDRLAPWISDWRGR